MEGKPHSVTTGYWDEGRLGDDTTPAYKGTWRCANSGHHIKPSHWQPMPKGPQKAAPALRALHACAMEPTRLIGGMPERVSS